MTVEAETTLKLVCLSVAMALVGGAIGASLMDHHKGFTLGGEGAFKVAIPNTSSFQDNGATVHQVQLQDGTTCAVVIANRVGSPGISCDWSHD